MSERQFAQIIGKARLYHYLPKHKKESVVDEFNLQLSDSQIALAAIGYFQNPDFGISNDKN